MKLKLNLADRISLEFFLPEKTGFKDLIIKEDILKKTKITQDDVVKYEIKEVNGNAFWNDEGSKEEFEIEFTELEIIFLRAAFTELAEKKELKRYHLNLAKQLINE